MKLINIHTATASEAAIVADLGRRTFYESWIHMHSEEDMQAYIKVAFDTEKIKNDLLNEQNTFFLANINSEIVGYVKLRGGKLPENHDFQDKKVIELERIYVLKPYQDKKVGKALMEKSLQYAMDKGFQVVWLGVYQENTKAIDFYKHFGFTIIGTKSFQIGNTINDDYMMSVELPHKR